MKKALVAICVLCLLVTAGCRMREEFADAPLEPPMTSVPEKSLLEPAPESSRSPDPGDALPEPNVDKPSPELTPVLDSDDQPQSPELPALPSEVPAQSGVGPASVSVPGQALREKATGVSWQEDGPLPFEDLRLVTVRFTGFDGQTGTGELLVHYALAEEVAEIFEEMYAAGFPVGQAVLIDEYGADDMLSMSANNTSGFCVRMIAGTDRYSMHSYGAAIDVNPGMNPYVGPNGVQPESAAEYLDRENLRHGMIVEGDACHEAFTSRGWIWGGDWPNPDYQHFEKAI